MNLERVLSRTKIKGNCWIWQGCLNTDGYPRAGWDGDFNKKLHREVFFWVNRYYPKVVRHSCDEPKCLNPDHLLPGDNLDNINDRISRARCRGHVSLKEGYHVLNLRKQGLTYKQIADELKVHPKRAEYICLKWSKGQVQFVV